MVFIALLAAFLCGSAVSVSCVLIGAWLWHRKEGAQSVGTASPIPSVAELRAELEQITGRKVEATSVDTGAEEFEEAKADDERSHTFGA